MPAGKNHLEKYIFVGIKVEYRFHTTARFRNDSDQF